MNPTDVRVITFTGTRSVSKISPERLTALSARLAELRVVGFTHLRHGDCVGMDQWTHYAALQAGYQVILHPCNLEDQRAWCAGAVHEHLPKPPLERNQDMVNSCFKVLAMPVTESGEPYRGGTWSTIFRARKRGISVELF